VQGFGELTDWIERKKIWLMCVQEVNIKTGPVSSRLASVISIRQAIKTLGSFGRMETES